MLRGIYTAAETMKTAFKKVDLFSHNISNAHTLGYKKKTYATHSFEDEMVKLKNGEEAAVSVGLELTDPGTDLSQGILRPTGAPLDLAVRGKNGFFVVKYKGGTTSDKLELTRNGRFQLDNERYLSTMTGGHVLDSAGNEIQFPKDVNESMILVNKKGVISYRDPKSPLGQEREQATLKLVAFKEASEQSLFNEDLNVLDALKAAGLNVPQDTEIDNSQQVWDDPNVKKAIKDDIEIRQGFVEESNVNIVSEMIGFMMSSKNFGMSEKLIQTEQKVLDKSINEMGRVQ